MKRLIFILQRMAMGDSYALAVFRWTLRCMDAATRQSLQDQHGRPLALHRVRVPLGDSHIMHSGGE